eukprot:2838994-Amphidinium_carterae.1
MLQRRSSYYKHRLTCSNGQLKAAFRKKSLEATTKTVVVPPRRSTKCQHLAPSRLQAAFGYDVPCQPNPPNPYLWAYLLKQ